VSVALGVLCDVVGLVGHVHATDLAVPELGHGADNQILTCLARRREISTNLSSGEISNFTLCIRENLSRTRSRIRNRLYICRDRKRALRSTQVTV